MRPILFEIFGLEIKAYGFFIALGFLFAIRLAVHFAKKEDADPELVYDLSLYLLLAGVLGARFLEVVVNYKDYIQRPLDIFAIWKGGLTYYGGLIAAVFVSIYYMKKKKMDFFLYADICAPSLALGLMFGRIGCFFAGCCYGRVAPPGSLCVTFTHPLTFASPRGVCLYPTQLYEAGAAFLIFLVLLLIKKYKTFKGQPFILFFLLYAPVRIGLEFLRNDVRGEYFNGMISTSQLIGIPLIIVGLAYYFYLRKKNRLT